MKIAAMCPLSFAFVMPKDDEFDSDCGALPCDIRERAITMHMVRRTLLTRFYKLLDSPTSS